MNSSITQRMNALLGLTFFLLLACGTAIAQSGTSSSSEAFDRLQPVTEVVYLLANSSIVIGSDPKGQSDEITFTGTVNIRKFPYPGFDRRKLDNGQYQIDFQLLNSELRGESYLLGGTVKLGEDKELPSLGVITQSEPGRDYPANFIVQRKVLIETPAGVFKNVEPVPVRGVIDSIPPFRLQTTPSTLNVFKGEQLPVAMLDGGGKVGGWFYSKMHMAFAVNPAELFRMQLTGEVVLEDQTGKRETVAIEGPSEFLRQMDSDKVECVKLGLRGRSKLLGGMIMITEGFSQSDRFSRGTLGIHDGAKGPVENSFPLYMEFKTPSGSMVVPAPVPIRGTARTQRQIETVQMKDRTVPVYEIETAGDYSGTGAFAITNEAENPSGIQLKAIRFHAIPKKLAAERRPCCPQPVQ
jgi:hypothetical protein